MGSKYPSSEFMSQWAVQQTPLALVDYTTQQTFITSVGRDAVLQQDRVRVQLFSRHKRVHDTVHGQNVPCGYTGNRRSN